jgi:hypothetical protein
MDERPWKPRRRSVNPAAIQMRVPGLRSINATNSPALYAQALNQRRPPHSPVLGPVSQYGDNSDRQKLRSRLVRRPSDAVLVLVSPLEHLVGVDPVLSRNSGNRRAGNKCRLDDASLLRWGPMNPFRRATGSNLNRLAHKVIVDLTAPPVYTVRSGRLHLFQQGVWINKAGVPRAEQ